MGAQWSLTVMVMECGDLTDPDDDNDGLSDVDEIDIYGTNPLVVDTDNDGFNDGIEVFAGTNPLDDQSIPMNLANGDINNDGLVNVIDLLLATQFVLGLKTPTAFELITW